jgi:hypothetical protein
MAITRDSREEGKNKSGGDLKFENFANVCDSSLEFRAVDGRKVIGVKSGL